MIDKKELYNQLLAEEKRLAALLLDVRIKIKRLRNVIAQQKFRENHPDKAREANAKWRAKYGKEYHRAYDAKRHFAKKQISASPQKAKILVDDDYLFSEHGLIKGRIVKALPNYTSTKRLKGYIVISPQKGTPVYMKIDEVKLLD